MKYAESAGNYNGSLHDSDGDGILDTVGYGHDVEKNEDIDLYINRTLTEKEGEALLIEDLKAHVPETWLQQMESAGHRFTANEIDALTSLFFAVGTGWASKQMSPNLTGLIESGDYTNQRMYDEFLTYDSGKENLSGLQKRHAAEARLFLFGTYDMTFYKREVDVCVE